MVEDRIGIRVAGPGDTDAIVHLINEAYRVESFFVGGDRIGRRDVAALVRKGECFVGDDAGRVVACIHTTTAGERGYFGMLAVAVDMQRRGLARRLIGHAEELARGKGCRLMDIKVVNLRRELFPYYEKLGYRVTGTEPYVHRPILQPCHMVLMEKELLS